ncbi:MAG: fatty acid desaturase [Fimbriimonadaceae bacterium]
MSAILQEAPAESIPNYRSTLKKALPASVFQPSLAPLWLFVPNAALIGVSLWLLTAYFSWWTAPLLAILIGNCMASLGFLAHDISHGGMVRQPFARDFLAGIAFSAFGIGPYLWRKWHNAAHHGNTQIEGEDPDHLLTMEHYRKSKILQWLYRLSPLARNVVIFGSFTFRMCQQTGMMMVRFWKSPEVDAKGRLNIVWQPIVQMGAWITLTLLIGGWPVLLFGYIIPLLVANVIAISYIATNHFLNPLADERDVLATSLSVTLPTWLSWLDKWHLHFGAHVGHHLFPQASPTKQRYIERKAAELWPDRYHSMPMFSALKALWDTPWVYDEEGTMLVNPRTQEKSPTLGHGLERRRKVK